MRDRQKPVQNLLLLGKRCRTQELVILLSYPRAFLDRNGESATIRLLMNNKAIGHVTYGKRFGGRCIVDLYFTEQNVKRDRAQAQETWVIR